MNPLCNLMSLATCSLRGKTNPKKYVNLKEYIIIDAALYSENANVFTLCIVFLDII